MAQYRISLGRSASPEPGDAAELRRAMTVLSLTADDVQADVAALQEATGLQVKIEQACEIYEHLLAEWRAAPTQEQLRD